jgi:hypothetical protein
MSARILPRLLLTLSLCGLVAAAAAADRTRVVNEGGIRDQWMLADGIKLAAPGYPAEFKDRGDNVCVAIAYAIKPDGSTSDFALLKQWSSAGDKEPVKGYFDAFATAGAGALSQWKFKPRPEVAEPQRTVTVATLHFTGKEPMDLAALRSHCLVSDLAAVIQEAKHKSTDRDRLRRDMEAHHRASMANGALISNPGAAQGRPITGRP